MEKFKQELGEWMVRVAKMTAEIVNTTPEKCKLCGSRRIVRYGHYQGVQRWWCKDCERKFADKLYLCRQRHRLSKYNWTNSEELEKMRHMYVEEGLTCLEVAKITGKGRSTVQRNLSKLGVIRKGTRG